MSLLRKWVAVANPKNSFQIRLSLPVIGIVLGGTFLLSLTFASISKYELTANRGQLVQNLAVQIAQSLDYKMYIHFQEVKALADVDIIKNPALPADRKRTLLDNLQQTNNDYAWIGLTSPQGIVKASANAILEQADVSQRPWFIAGQKTATVQDVHGAKLLAELVPNPSPDNEPIRFVDIAVPVFSNQSDLVGVLGAHLYWHWAVRLRDGLMAPLESYYHVEVFLLSADGEVLLAPRLKIIEPVVPSTLATESQTFLTNLPS